MADEKHSVTLSASASTYKRFMEIAQEQSMLLALKVDELNLVNGELLRQNEELKKGK